MPRACRSSSSSSPSPATSAPTSRRKRPGSIHEGGELGYSLSHAYGACLDNPDLIVACVVGDGEAETGPLATAWHSNKFINPIRDGAVLPILNLNGYKIANPTILARISHDRARSAVPRLRLHALLRRGRRSPRPCTSDGATLDTAIAEIRRIQRRGAPERPGTLPALADDRAALAQGLDRAQGDQRPQGRGLLALAPGAVLRRATNPAHLKLLEDWMRATGPRSCSTPTAGWCRSCASWHPGAAGA
jgi:xylulose-5-phosphate/fructose-6-phosphate phosphoketolase